MADGPDIAAGRLQADLYGANFGDVADPLDRGGALIDAARCYFCHDAPCIEACPTGIDIPGFIRRIGSDNVCKGNAWNIIWPIGANNWWIYRRSCRYPASVRAQRDPSPRGAPYPSALLPIFPANCRR